MSREERARELNHLLATWTELRSWIANLDLTIGRLEGRREVWRQRALDLERQMLRLVTRTEQSATAWSVQRGACRVVRDSQ